MPNPTQGDVHVNRPLTNISIAYIQKLTNFIADRAFPAIPVMKQSDSYFTYSRADFNRDEMKVRAAGTESAGSGYGVDADNTYYCPVEAYHKDVSDQVRGNTDDPLNADRDATLFVTNKAMIRRERKWATTAMVSDAWSQGLSGVASNPGTGEFIVWSDAASTPIEDVRGAKRAVLEATGFEPNVITFGKEAYDALLDHPDIIDRIKYTSSPGNPAVVNEQSLAALFELEEVQVSKAVYNTAKEGVTESSTFIAGPHALVHYRNPTPGIMQPSSGYSFSWNGWMGASALGHRIKRFRMEQLESDRIEIQMAISHKIVGADLGYFFSDAATSASPHAVSA